MKITVCELPNDPAPLAESWDALVDHATAMRPDVVLLPELPFHPWVGWTKVVDPAEWIRAERSHDEYLKRLGELGAGLVLGSRPITDGDRRLNEGFVWSDGEYTPAHHKYYLPDEEGFWEATWYARGNGSFEPAPTPVGPAGFLICTELWFTEHARAYARNDVSILANPRATEWSSRDRWLAGGRAAAVMSGAFCASSNRSGLDGTGLHWGGLAWVIDPNGEVLATTSSDHPFATVDVDLLEAQLAKETYPRYVEE